MKWVKFTKIELKNYRQFIDETIKFPDHAKGKPFNIILGRNGFGKSNLFNAITWCFYGSEKHLNKSKAEDMLPILNKSVAKKLKRGEIAEVKIVISLDSDEGPIILTRTVNFRGTGEGLPYMDEETAFRVMITVGKGNWIESPGPTTVVNRILPEVVQNFFFLDGERLRQQFEDINEEEVKNSILDISQITLLEKAMKHLENVESEFRVGNKGQTPETDSLDAEIKFIEKELAAIPGIIKRIDEEKNTAEKNMKQLEQELRESSSKDVKNFQLKKDELTESKETAEGELEDLKKEHITFLIEGAQTIYSVTAIKKALELINKAVKEGRIPAKIEHVFLQELLKKKECICGSDISHGEKRERMLKLLKETEISSEVSDYAKEIKYALKAKVNNQKDFENKSDYYSKKIDELEGKIGDYTLKLNEISNKLKKYKSSLENISDKEKAIEEYRTAIQELIEKKTNRKRDEQELDSKLKNKTREYIELMEKIGKNKEIIKKLEFLHSCNDSLLEIKKELLTEIRKEIESYVQKSFFENLITEKKLKEVKIDEDYKISVLTEEGYNTLKSLSAGETLCLALSFMAAFRNISGFAAPIIIDTPLAKIDEEYRENVLNFLVNSLKNTQITLLVMSSEYTDKVKKVIKQYINKNYTIEFDKSTGISTINEK